MSKREAPEYVVEWQKANNVDNRYTVSFIYGGYYVYLRRVAGQNDRVYLGSLKEDGFHPKKPQKGKDFKEPVPLVNQTVPSQLPVKESAGLICREYGFTKVMLDLCPKSWKDDVGKDWELALRDIILYYSKNSYLLSSSTSTSARKHYYGSTAVLLDQKLPVSIREIFNMFGNVIVIISEEQRIISALTSEQREFCNKYGIHLEVM